MSIAMAVHVLAAVIWVGGMFFAHFMVRPASLELEIPLRVGLWSRILGRFFPWVWGCVIALLISGYWMIFVELGGFADTSVHIHIMHGLGWLMILLFLFAFFAPFQSLKKMVRELLFPEAGLEINRIRLIVTINLFLGLTVSAIAASGRYWVW
ncbi:MAG: CopD family protein [Magnetococcales bacterium]|nr:CopD family protein [Magnetococcales bacterium]